MGNDKKEARAAGMMPASVSGEEVPQGQTDLMAAAGDPAPGVTDPPVVDAVDDAVSRGVEAWLDDHIRNSAVSQHTESWNLLVEKTPLLADYIRKEMN